MKKIQNLMQIFDRLGFPKNTASVYGAIKNYGPLSASDIALHTKLHRPAIYRSIYALTDAKLITPEKNGKRIRYSAESVQRVMNLFVKEIDDISKIINVKKVPEEETEKSLKILRGPKGIQSAFDDVIKHSKIGDTFYRYTSEKDLSRVNAYLSADYRAQRDKKKLERLVISNPISGKQKRPRLERLIKFIPPGENIFDQDIIQLIYSNRVAIIDLKNEKSVIIENPQLADFQKVIFKQLYKRL